MSRIPNCRLAESLHEFTPRHVDIAEGVRDGLTNKEIATRYGITEATVKVHLRAVLQLVGLRNRTELAVAWDRLRPKAEDEA